MEKGFSRYFIQQVVLYAHAQEKRDLALLDKRELKRQQWKYLLKWPISVMLKFCALPFFICTHTVLLVFIFIDLIALAPFFAIAAFFLVFPVLSPDNYNPLLVIDDVFQLDSYTDICFHDRAVYYLIQCPLEYVVAHKSQVLHLIDLILSIPHTVSTPAGGIGALTAFIYG